MKRKIVLMAGFILILCSVEIFVALYCSHKANARISEKNTQMAEQLTTNADYEGTDSQKAMEETTNDITSDITESILADSEESTSESIGIKQVEQVVIPKVRASYIGPGFAISCWGDSLTEGTGALGGIVINGVRAATMPSTLANLTNMRVYNMGVYGELSRDIACRQGGLKMYVNNLIIPASGSVSFKEILCEDGTTINPWTKPDDLEVFGLSYCFDNCSIAGITGRLTYDFETEEFIFTRLDSSDEPETVPMISNKTINEESTKVSSAQGTQSSTVASANDIQNTTQADTATKAEPTTSADHATKEIKIVGPAQIITPPSIERVGDILILEMGNNDESRGNLDYNNLVDQYQAMIDHNGNNYFIIIGDTDGSDEDRADWDYTLQQAFGDHFINMRRYLIDLAANGGLSQFGITLNDFDYLKISRGEVPFALKSDESHLNSYGYWLEGKAVYDRGLELGYWVE